jgi:hypothetical protein
MSLVGTKLPNRDVRSTVAVGVNRHEADGQIRSGMTRSSAEADRTGVPHRCTAPVWRPTSVIPEISPVFFREHVRIEVSDPLLALLRDLQIPECIADIGTDRLPEESGVRCS